MQHLPKSRNMPSHISTVSLVNQEHSEQHKQFLKTIDRLDTRVSWIIKRLLPLNIPDDFNGWAWLATVTLDEILQVHAVGPKRAEQTFRTIQNLLAVSAPGQNNGDTPLASHLIDHDAAQILAHLRALPPIPLSQIDSQLHSLLHTNDVVTENDTVTIADIVAAYFPVTRDSEWTHLRNQPFGPLIKMHLFPEIRVWLENSQDQFNNASYRHEIAAALILLGLAAETRWNPWVLTEMIQCDTATLQNAYQYIKPHLMKRDRARIEGYFTDLAVAHAYVNGQSFTELGAAEGTTGEAVRRRLGRMGVTSELARNIRRSSDENRMNDDHPEFASTKERINTYVLAHPGCTIEEISEHLGWDEEPGRSLLRDIQHLILRDVKPNAQHIRTTERQIAAAVTSLQQAAAYHSPLTGPIYDQLVRDRIIRGVSSQRMFQLFGTWTAACEAAGIEFRGTPDRDYERRWTEEDILEWVCDYFLDLEFRGASQRYDEWRKHHQDRDDIPSAGSIRNYLSRSWDEVGILTLQQLRSTWN